MKALLKLITITLLVAAMSSCAAIGGRPYTDGCPAKVQFIKHVESSKYLYRNESYYTGMQGKKKSIYFIKVKRKK